MMPCAHVSRKLIAQRTPRYAHNGEMLGQQIRLAQVKQRRQQLALGQIAGGAKDHQNPRIGNPLPAWEPGKDPPGERSSASDAIRDLRRPASGSEISGQCSQ